MTQILTLLLTQISERLVLVLLLAILEKLRPLVDDTSNQLDDVALDAMITALKLEQEKATSERAGNGGTV